MPPCKTRRCHNQVRTSPGALFCQECHDAKLADIERRWRKPLRCITPAEAKRNHASDLKALGGPKVKFLAPKGPLPPPPTSGIFDGSPNVICPACAGRYHYGPSAPFTHLCPLCDIWLCWKETNEIVTKKRQVRECPRCGGGVTLRGGKHGDFYGCDNYPACKGIAKIFRIEEYDAPRLGLAVWKPHVWDGGDAVDHFARLDRETQERKTAIEARVNKYKKRWWKRGPGLGLDEDGDF